MPRKRKVNQRKPKLLGGKKRRYRRRGGALSDYIPSANTIASYIPGGQTALGYYNSIPSYQDAKNAYGQAKDLYNTYNTTVKPAIDLYNQFSKPGPPPLPSGGPPSLSRADQLHNKRLRDIQDRGARNTEYNRKVMENFYKGQQPQLPGFVQKARSIRPISFIDNALRVTGQRDRVRNYLQNKGLGSLVSGADLAIQAGFGRRNRGGLRRVRIRKHTFSRKSLSRGYRRR
jgi:hypothetical protein